MLEGTVVFEGITAKGAPILIRYPRRDDLHQMWQFINALSAERTFILFQGEEISLESETHYLDSILKQLEEGLRVQLTVFSGTNMIANSEICLLTGVRRRVGDFGIVVADGYRGMGIGRLLMELVIKEAIGHLSGMQMITLEVFGNNPIAMDLYRKVGFVEYGRLPKGIVHRDQPVDSVLMV